MFVPSFFRSHIYPSPPTPYVPPSPKGTMSCITSLKRESRARRLATTRVEKYSIKSGFPRLPNHLVIDLTGDEIDIVNPKKKKPSPLISSLSSARFAQMTPPDSAVNSPQKPMPQSWIDPISERVSYEPIDLTNDDSDTELTDSSVDSLAEHLASIQPLDFYEEHRHLPPLASAKRNFLSSDCLEYVPGQSVMLIDGNFFHIEGVEQVSGAQVFFGRHLTPATEVEEKIGVPRVGGELVWITHITHCVAVSDIKEACHIRFTNDRRSRWRNRAQSDLVCRLKLTILTRDPIQTSPGKKETPAGNREYTIEYLTFKEVQDTSCAARTEKELRECWRGNGNTIPFGAKESATHPLPICLDDDCPDIQVSDLDPIRNRKYTFGDAYCGAGGVSCGAQKAGLELTWSVDKNLDAITTYRANFPHCLAEHSEFSDFMTNRSADLLVDVCHTSPPCQPFSPAHTIANEVQDEMNSACIFTSRDLILKARPRILTMEETFGLKDRHHVVFARVIMDFVEVGYSVRWAVLDCVNYGVPQMRRRLIIYAAGPGEMLPKLPAPTHGPPGSFLKPFETIDAAIDGIPDEVPDHDTAPFIERGQKAYREPYPSDRPARTLTCSGGAANYHPSGTRGLTVREAACLQTFPMNFKLCGRGRRKQVGNAVPPRFARAILREVCRSLRATDEKELLE